MPLKRRSPKPSLEGLDSGIRLYVEIIRRAGVDTLSSCQGRNNPGYHPKTDGAHHGDWPYVMLNGTTTDAYIAAGAALSAGLPVRSIEQSWVTYPGEPRVLVGPRWRITFWEKDQSSG